MKNIRVLMIDDNIDLIKMVKEYFSDHASIDISLEAHDGVEGMRLIKENQCDYDVVLLDLIMPKRDGVSVLEEMQDLELNKKVIVITSYNNENMIRRVSELGINYFILKPFDLMDLEKRILSCKEEIKETPEETIEALKVVKEKWEKLIKELKEAVVNKDDFIKEKIDNLKPSIVEESYFS